MEKIPVKKKMKKLISQTQYLTQFLRSIMKRAPKKSSFLEISQKILLPMTPGGRLAEHTVIFGSVPVLPGLVLYLPDNTRYCLKNDNPFHPSTCTPPLFSCCNSCNHHHHHHPIAIPLVDGQSRRSLG